MQRGEVARHVRVGLELLPQLDDVDVHGCLTVSRRAEDLALPGGNGRIARDQDRGDTAESLDAKRQRRNIEEHDVLDVTRQDPGLDDSADAHHLVGPETQERERVVADVALEVAHAHVREVAELGGLDREQDVAAGPQGPEVVGALVVIDPAGLDDSVDSYYEQEVPFYGGLSRIVNRNDAAVVATGVGGAVVYRNREFRDGYGTTAKSGRFLKAGARSSQKRLARAHV